MKTRIQSIVWTLFLGIALSLLMTGCQKESFLNIEPEKTVYQSNRVDNSPNVGDSQEDVTQVSASDAVLPVVLRVNCQIITILYKPDEKVQVYKCKGEDLHNQKPVEINGKRHKSYLTGAVTNKGVVTYADGAFRIDQIDGNETESLNFELTGLSGTMAGIAGVGKWFDPNGWLAGTSLFEGTLQ